MSSSAQFASGISDEEAAVLWSPPGNNGEDFVVLAAKLHFGLNFVFWSSFCGDCVNQTDGTSEGDAGAVFASSLWYPSRGEGQPRAACTHSNTLLCFLPRIDKTMLASLKIK